LDGGRQYFTRAFDFGYSKTAEETFRYWPREELLRDVTWVVRSFRPQVIVSVFSGTPRDGHGHHQVSGIIAQEVYDVAGDPSRFPEQVAAGVPPWTPLKLYRLTRRDPQEGTTGIETGAFDPLLGRSYFQIAMESRSQHRSQDMGVAQPMGPRRSTVVLVESRVDADGPDEIFAGVDTALVTLTRSLPEGGREEVAELLAEYRAAIAEANEVLDVIEPWRAAPPLGRALGALRGVLDALGGSRSPGLAGDESSELRRSLRTRLPLVQEALLRSAGVVWEVRVEDDLLVPGEEVEGVVELWNGGPYLLGDASGLLAVPEGWRVSGALGEAENVLPGSLARWRFQLQVPVGAELSRTYYLGEDREGELYRWSRDMSLWAAPTNPDLFHGILSFEVGELGGVEVRKPARFRGVDKATGEFVKPVQVVPALSVSLDSPLMVWPTRAEDAKEFTVTILSQSEEQLGGTVSLLVPDGWRADPEGYAFSLSEAGVESSFSFRVTRPAGLADGRYSVAARVRTDDGRDYQHGVSMVDYPHIRRGVLFPSARSRVSVFPVSVDGGIRVGYVMGSGDGGAEAIHQMGAEVELLGSEALRAGNFRAFDVVVLGIRAYETRPDLVAANDRLLDFVRDGGTLIVQSNKYE
jgi:hypothetical protein